MRLARTLLGEIMGLETIGMAPIMAAAGAGETAAAALPAMTSMMAAPLASAMMPPGMGMAMPPVAPGAPNRSIGSMLQFLVPPSTDPAAPPTVPPIAQNPYAALMPKIGLDLTPRRQDTRAPDVRMSPVVGPGKAPQLVAQTPNRTSPIQRAIALLRR